MKKPKIQFWMTYHGRTYCGPCWEGYGMLAHSLRPGVLLPEDGDDYECERCGATNKRKNHETDERS